MSQGIPWSIAVPSEVYTEYCGATMSAYHGDPAVQMDVQLRGPQILHEQYGLPLHRSVAPDFTTYVTGSVFGLQFEVFEDQVPAPKGHPIGSIEQAAALRVPENMRNAGYFPAALDFYHYMREHAPADVSIGFSGGSQAPFTTAVLLRGEGFLMDLLDRPDLAHRFLQTLTDSSIRQRQLANELNGVTEISAIGFTDDYGGLLGPNLYHKFDVQYMLQIAGHFGAGSLSIHTELLRKPHLAILQECGWTYIDVGTDPYLSIRDCREVLHIPFLVQMKTSGEMLLSTPARIRERYREMVEEGATQMLVELCRGVPEENIRAFIEVAKEFE
ncbi:MAG: uroporphyrinogen decarboxylase family protein [Armatimonadia bacterium]